MTPLFTAQKEVARRYAANQEMAVVLNKMLQAHERELRARMLVEMPRTQPVLPAIAKQNQQALEHYADLRQAAVLEVCDTIHDRLLDAAAAGLKEIERAKASARLIAPMLWVGAIP
jgi:hypothetical protein